MVRIVGALLFLFGSAGTAYATWAAYERPRPKDVLFAVLAPLAFVIALSGLLMLFVPDFF